MKSANDIAMYMYHNVMSPSQQQIVRCGMMPVELNEWLENLYKEQYYKFQLNSFGGVEEEVEEMADKFGIDLYPSKEKVATFSRKVFVELLKVSNCPF